MCSKDEVFKLDLWGSLQRGAHNFHLSPPDEGREMRHKEIKKLRTKRSVWCLQPPSRWINTSVRAWGQAKASDNGALQVWGPFISLCNSGFPTARGPTHLKGSMECHPCPSCWKSCELDTVCQHWPPAPQEGLWELLSWHNTRDTQQQPLCPAQQDRPRAVLCWKAELPWGWNLGNFSTRGGANTGTQQPSQAHWAPLTPRGDTGTLVCLPGVQIRQGCSASGDIPPSPSSYSTFPPPRGAQGTSEKETGRQLNFSEMNAFLHVLDHYLINMDVVHHSLAYSRHIKCVTGAEWLTHAPWARHEKCYFYSSFHPTFYCTAFSNAT